MPISNPYGPGDVGSLPSILGWTQRGVDEFSTYILRWNVVPWADPFDHVMYAEVESGIDIDNDGVVGSATALGQYLAAGNLFSIQWFMYGAGWSHNGEAWYETPNLGDVPVIGPGDDPFDGGGPEDPDIPDDGVDIPNDSDDNIDEVPVMTMGIARISLSKFGVAARLYQRASVRARSGGPQGLARDLLVGTGIWTIGEEILTFIDESVFDLPIIGDNTSNNDDIAVIAKAMLEAEANGDIFRPKWRTRDGEMVSASRYLVIDTWKLESDPDRAMYYKDKMYNKNYIDAIKEGEKTAAFRGKRAVAKRKN